MFQLSKNSCLWWKLQSSKALINIARTLAASTHKNQNSSSAQYTSNASTIEQEQR